MTDDLISVLRATPASGRPPASLGRIAGHVDDLEPTMVSARLKALHTMGLVQLDGGWWSRTPQGDVEAGREA